MKIRHGRTAMWLVILALWTGANSSRADTVTDWNAKAGNIVFASAALPPQMYRAMAIVQVAVHDSVSAITGRYEPIRAKIDAPPGASLDAAIAAATCTTLLKLVPAQQPAIDAAYQSAVAAIADGPAKSNGIAVGEKAATAVLEARASDGTSAAEDYRPRTSPGVYVSTVLPIVPQWGKRVPWSMTRSDQFRPGPPPDLAGEAWARDYNEIRTMGARTGSARTTEQTEAARFWSAATPTLYFDVARSLIAGRAGRDPAANARLLAAVGIAMDDAWIAVLDAKYAYNFWRPVTAIRNGDIDGNDKTERDASWLPMIDTPLHPEYPCAHCIIAAAVAAVLDASVGTAPMPRLTSTSPTVPGISHSWDRTDALVTEVTLARIYGGVHYRNSTQVGRAMGKLIGEQVAKNFPLVVR